MNSDAKYKIYEAWKERAENTTMTGEEWLEASEALIKKLQESREFGPDDLHE